jgi:hypothetical protein
LNIILSFITVISNLSPAFIFSNQNTTHIFSLYVPHVLPF